MHREIYNDVKIGDSATPFKSVRKSPAIDKTASDFDNENLKVKKKQITYQAWNLQCGHSWIYSWNFGPGLSGND